MTTWNIDKVHSTIGFKVKHLMVSTVRGNFKEFEGSVTSADDTFLNATVQFTAQVKSVDTNNDMRDQHLHSAEFFDAEKFPTITFASTSFTKKGDGYEIVGDMTMHGVTKPITLSATSDGIGTGMDGGRVVGFDLNGSINRSDFGLTWNKVLETGAVVVSDAVIFDIHVEAKEAK